MDKLEEIKDHLDAELSRREDVTGVGFGMLLFDDFVKRGWIKYVKLEFVGSGEHIRWPVYNDRYHANPWENIPPSEFRLPLPQREPW